MCPSSETIGVGPHTSKWTNSKGKEEYGTCLGIECLCILALIQAAHWEKMSLFTGIWADWKSDQVEWRILEQGWPSLLCQSKAWSDIATKPVELTNEEERLDSGGIG